jgi:hypothetical protein
MIYLTLDELLHIAERVLGTPPQVAVPEIAEILADATEPRRRQNP